MKTHSRFSFALLSTLFVSHSVAAQTRIWEACPSTSGIEYGRAIALSDLDGDGDDEVIVGAPGQLQFGMTGWVYFHSTFLAVSGDDVDDQFGASLAGGLNLDGDSMGDVLAGAPGDDDNGDACGSVTALTADRIKMYTLYGDAAGDEFGTSVARIGDLDGDGFCDYVVGAPQSATGGNGYARVISGLLATEIRTHLGASPGDRFGMGLIGCGDVNGDSLPDYAIGAPDELGVGRVRVFSGSDGSVIRSHDGSTPGSEFGYALGSQTDLDRDATDDLIVGAPNSALAPGSVFALSGATGMQLASLSDGEADERFGASVAGVRDLDGDGFGDWAVGAPGVYFNGFPNDAGYASVYSGSNGALLLRNGGGWGGAANGTAVASGDVDGDGLGDVVIGGVMNNDGYGNGTSCVSAFGRNDDQRVSRGADRSLYGAAVASIGDLDADGRRELLVGAPLAENPQGDSTGCVRVETPEGTLLFEHFGDFDGDRFGAAVANAGDVDLDGIDDLIVGSASRTSGAPTGVGYARVYSGATGLVLHTFAGPGSSAFGAAVAGGGDIDNDGHCDLIVGGSRDLLNFGQDGHVRVYSGKTGAVLHAIDSPPNQGEGLGASVVILDDIDGDGHDDFAFGAPERPVGAPWFTLGEVEFRSGSSGALIDTFNVFDLRLGTSLAVIDDLDGDGLRDVVAGTWEPDVQGSYGSVHAVSSATRDELWVAQETVSYEGLAFGYALSASGDHDGDGVGDVLVGQPGTNTSSARAIGSAQVLSGASGSTLQTITGYSGWDYFGYTVTGLGDVDGDGAPDMAVGAPTDPFNPFGAEPGQNRVHVVLSDWLRKQNYCPQAPNSTGETGDLDASGSSSIAKNDLKLAATDLPALKPGAFLLGSHATSIPYFAGYLCVGGTVGRISPVVPTGPGLVAYDVDLLQSPQSFITPGSSWSFQFLFRDAGSINATDAVRIEFLP